MESDAPALIPVPHDAIATCLRHAGVDPASVRPGVPVIVPAENGPLRLRFESVVGPDLVIPFVYEVGSG